MRHKESIRRDKFMAELMHTMFFKWGQLVNSHVKEAQLSEKRVINKLEQE